MDPRSINPALILAAMPRQASGKKPPRERSRVLEAIRPHELAPDTPMRKIVTAAGGTRGRYEHVEQALEQAEHEAVDTETLRLHALARPGDEPTPSDGYGPMFEMVQENDGTTRRVELTLEQRVARFNKQLFGRAFRQQRQTLEELLPYRIRAAWRIVRELARHKGIAQHDDPLSEVLQARTFFGQYNPDPWTLPSPHRLPDAPELRRRLFPEIIELIKASETLPNELAIQRWGRPEDSPDAPDQWIYWRGFGLLPPPVPERYMIWYENGEEPSVSDLYNPEIVDFDTQTGDINLHLWLEACKTIVLRLGIAQGTALDPDQGRLGTYGLLDPELCRMCWPTRIQIMTWESIVVEETLDAIVRTSVHATKQYLRDKYGYNHLEIVGLIRLASQLAREQTTGDREDGRAIMILKLEEYIRRSREALDLRSEMNGMKQLSMILGLTDAAHNDPFTEFMHAVKSVSREREGMTKRLDGPLPVLGEATVIDPAYSDGDNE